VQELDAAGRARVALEALVVRAASVALGPVCCFGQAAAQALRAGSLQGKRIDRVMAAAGERGRATATIPRARSAQAATASRRPRGVGAAGASIAGLEADRIHRARRVDVADAVRVAVAQLRPRPRPRLPVPGRIRVYTALHGVYTACVAKHLIDVDERALRSARAELGTTTIKDTVNEALRRATVLRERQVAAAIDVLADAHLDDRSDAWR